MYRDDHLAAHPVDDFLLSAAAHWTGCVTHQRSSLLVSEPEFPAGINAIAFSEKISIYTMSLFTVASSYSKYGL